MKTMDKNNIIYIIVPVYLTEKYINKCVDSILGQTYLNFLLILVDDGSPDNCGVICDEYERKDKRIKVIHKQNGGVSSARNVALDYIGKLDDGYVTFIDSDDWIDKNYLKTLLSLLTINKVDLVCSVYNSSCKLISKNVGFAHKGIVYSYLEATKLLLEDEIIQSHSWSKLFKSHLWKDVRFDENLHYMEDQATIYKTFYRCKNVLITDYLGYFYRQDNRDAVTKKAIDNKKIISGLIGYYSPVEFDFIPCDRVVLLPSIHHGLVSAYLMLIPYYKNKNATKGEKDSFSIIKSYIKKEKLMKKFEPVTTAEKVKLMLYKACPKFYPTFFKIAKKIYQL